MKEIDSLKDIIGNQNAKLLLQDAIISAKNNNTSLEHIMLYGTSGCGKSTFARVLSKEMGVEFNEVNCSLLNGNPQLLNQMIMKMPEKGILFLDEAHAMDDSTMETLYKYLDSRILYVKYPTGLVSIDVEKNVSIICATSEIVEIPIPFMNRFNIQIKLSSYNHEDMHDIVVQNLESEQLNLTDEAIEILINASRFIPRTAQQFIKIIKRYGNANKVDCIDDKHIKNALMRNGIDEFGYSEVDRSYIRTLFYILNNNASGIDLISNIMNESKKILITQHEPHLIKMGILIRTSNGRMLSPKGIKLAIGLGES